MSKPLMFANATPKFVGKGKWGWPEYRTICGCSMNDYSTNPDFAATTTAIDEIRLLPRRIDDFSEVYEGACKKCGQVYYLTAEKAPTTYLNHGCA